MNILIAIDRILGPVYVEVLTVCKFLSDDGGISVGSYIDCCSISQQTIATIWYVFPTPKILNIKLHEQISNALLLVL
jgi:hypothetical protein